MGTAFESGAAVLITGCSSGMGKATALRIHRQGWQVYATSRDTDSMAELADLGIQTRFLDLRDTGSMKKVVDEIIASHGAVSALVNNAGYSLNGAIEETPVSAARAQFEANFFGPAELIRLVLPGMREQGAGRIVNISSFFGRFGTAGRGYYQASKHALEALSDALRSEVAGLGVRVVVIQPGPTFSRFFDTSDATLSDTAASGDYADFWRRFHEWHEPYRHPELPRGRGRFTLSPEDVARAVERVLAAPDPAPRYPVGTLARLLLLIHRALPGRVFDTFSHAIFPVPRWHSAASSSQQIG